MCKPSAKPTAQHAAGCQGSLEVSYADVSGGLGAAPPIISGTQLRTTHLNHLLMIVALPPANSLATMIDDDLVTGVKDHRPKSNGRAGMLYYNTFLRTDRNHPAMSDYDEIINDHIQPAFPSATIDSCQADCEPFLTNLSH